MRGISLRAMALPAFVAIVAAGGVVLLWQTLREDHESRVANVAEATSYATRSELARRLIVQFQAFRTLADAWIAATNETDRPAGAAATLDLIRFEGVDAIAWSETDGTRFIASGANPIMGYIPTAAEWAPIQPFVGEAYAAASETVRGPFFDDDGHAIFRYYLPVRRALRRGVLVAIIDAHDLLEALLVDEALGYEIRVMCCDSAELYRRGTADEELPVAWARDGWIAPISGIRWNVAHRPSPELADDLETSAVDSVLIVGLALSLLLGGLVFETRRANDRAAAATTAERRIRTLNRELEERVVARTQELNDVLTDLNTINLSVSHDLRSPLNAINLQVGRLREENGRDRGVAERYDKIAASIGRMAAILDRLLGYSRVSSFETELGEVDMRALVEQVVEEQSIPKHAVTFGELPPARADRMIVHILLGNLIGNAAKYGRGDGGLRLTIGSRIEDGVTAYFVRDNGPGLDKELANRLFKPMKKRPKTARGGGLGLGLAIAARAVERHDGEIWVESEPGQGATFLFTLRLSTNPIQ